MGERFPDAMLTPGDFLKAHAIVGEPQPLWNSAKGLRRPDVIIAPDGDPYLYRWHLVRGPEANVYFHIQTADDPERPLHDHPWDNQSVILAGGYHETLDQRPKLTAMGAKGGLQEFSRKPGDVIWRKAEWAHTLRLPEGVDYTMTLFSTGPKVREWGFYYPEGWKLWTDVTRLVGNKSIHIHNEAMS